MILKWVKTSIETLLRTTCKKQMLCCENSVNSTVGSKVRKI